jgi:hypothetical protein
MPTSRRIAAKVSGDKAVMGNGSAGANVPSKRNTIRSIEAGFSSTTGKRESDNWLIQPVKSWSYNSLAIKLSEEILETE